MGELNGNKDVLGIFNPNVHKTSPTDDLDSHDKPKQCLHGSNCTFTGEGEDWR